MNCAAPEVDALCFFWPRLSPGAVVLLDDYAFLGADEQRLAMDGLASQLGCRSAHRPLARVFLSSRHDRAA
jgi:hypothetical protein